jgi:hypothetical protein
MSKKVAQEIAITLEALIEIAHECGLHINNLNEVEDGWRTNVNDGSEFYEFGKGKTASETLQAAPDGAVGRSPNFSNDLLGDR